MRIFFENKRYFAVITLVSTLVVAGIFFVSPRTVLSATTPAQKVFLKTAELSRSARIITGSCSFDSNQNAPNDPPSIYTDLPVGYTCNDYTYKVAGTRAWSLRFRVFTVQAVAAGPNEFSVAQSNQSGASKSNSCWFDTDDNSSNYPPDTTNLPIGYSCNDYIKNDGGTYQWRQFVVQTPILRRYCIKGFCYPSITAKNNSSITQSVPRAFITEKDASNKFWPRVGEKLYDRHSYCVGGKCFSGKAPEITQFSVNPYYDTGSSTPGRYVDFKAIDINEFQIFATGTPGFYNYNNGPRCACDVDENIKDVDCSGGITSEIRKCQDIYKQGKDYYARKLEKKPIFYVEKVKIDRIDPSQTVHNDYFYEEIVVNPSVTQKGLKRSSGHIFATKQAGSCSAQIVKQEVLYGGPGFTSSATGANVVESHFQFKLSPIEFVKVQDQTIWCRVRLASQVGEDVMIYFPPLSTVIRDPQIVSFTAAENYNDAGVKTLNTSYRKGFYLKTNITGDYDPPQVIEEYNGAVIRTLAYNDFNGRFFNDLNSGTYVFKLVVKGRAPALSSQVTDSVTVNVGKASPTPFSFRAGTDRSNLSGGPITVQPGGELFLDWDIKENGNFVLHDYLADSEVNQDITQDIPRLGIRNWYGIEHLQPGSHRFVMTQYFDTTQFNVSELSKEIQVTVITPPPTVERFTANGAAYATAIEYCKDTLRLDWETRNTTGVTVSGPRIDESLQSKVSQYANGNIINLRPKTSQSPALYQIIAKNFDLSSSPEPVAVYIDRGVSCFEECLINQAESIFPRAKLLRQNESVKRCVGSWYNGQCCTGVLVGDRCAGNWGPGYDAQSDDVILCNALEWGTKTVTRIAKEPTSAFQAAGVKIMCILHFATKIYDGEKDQCKGRLPNEDFPVNEVVKNVGDGLGKGALPGFVGGMIGGVIGGVPIPFVSCIPGVAEVVRIFVGFFTGIIGELIGQAAADAFTVPPDPNKLGEGLGYLVGDIVGREMGYELGSSLWSILDLFNIKIGDINLDKLGAYSCPSTELSKPPPPPPVKPEDPPKGIPPAEGILSGPGVTCPAGNCQLIVEGTNVKAVNALANANDHVEVNSVQTAITVKAAEQGVEEVIKGNNKLTPNQIARLDKDKVWVIPDSSKTVGKFIKENPRQFTTTVAHIKYNTEKFIVATGSNSDSAFANEFAYAMKKRLGMPDGEIKKFLYKNGQSGEFSAFVKAAAKCIIDTSSCSK